MLGAERRVTGHVGRGSSGGGAGRIRSLWLRHAGRGPVGSGLDGPGAVWWAGRTRGSARQAGSEVRTATGRNAGARRNRAPAAGGSIQSPMPSITSGGTARTLSWDSGMVPGGENPDDWKRLWLLVILIRDIVLAHPEFQALPHVRGARD